VLSLWSGEFRDYLAFEICRADLEPPRLAFILSMATLLTAATHRPDTLRGLSRWTLAFVTNGPNAGFWKRQRRDPSVPPTPSVPATPATSQFPDKGASTSRSQSPLVKQ